MANLNLPGHDSSPVFIFSYLLYMKKTYPALGRAQSSRHTWLAWHGWAWPWLLSVALPAAWSRSLQTWGGEEQPHALSGATGNNVLPRKGETGERHVQSSK